ncbi:MAG: IPTL-CTERM sorting domain-containing protein [Desulfobacterales bacterium]|nr:IPTL-CTERM sorting domain-containing protein [Desulfobacterales bacterium]
MRTSLKITGRGLFILFLIIMTSAAALAQAPTFTKAFNPDTIGPGSVSTLTFTITNAGGTPVTNMDFTDNLPGGVTIADPPDASCNCLGAIGVLTAPAGGTVISLTDGSLAGSSSCTVVVDVTSSVVATHTNLSGALTSSLGNSGTATNTLMVVTTLPGFTKAFDPTSVPLGGRSTLTFTIDNTLNTSPVINLDFTDNLPTGMVVADPANAYTDCISAGLPDTTLTAVPGTGVITLNADGAGFPGFEVLPSGATCTVAVDVIATGSGILGNSSEELLASFVSAGKANATLNVTRTTLALTKTFTDDPTPPGHDITLEFTISNFDRFNAITGITFTDDLNAALAGLVATDLPKSDVCGTGSSLTGTSTLTLADASLAGGDSCTFSATLTVPAGAAPGDYLNQTNAISGTLSGDATTGNTAGDSLFVQPGPILTKEFTDDPVGVGEEVTLEFTVTNTSTTSGAADITFLDELTTFLPFPVTVDLPPTPNPPCGTGSSLGFVFPDTDRQALRLNGGNLAASGTCTFSVPITIPADFPAGVYTNTTEEITAIVDGTIYTGGPATAALEVVSGPKLSKSFIDDPVQAGDTVTLKFTLTHSANNPAAATGITFTDDLTAIMAGLVSTSPTQTGICGPGSEISGTSTLSFTGGILSPGDDCAFSVTLQTPGAAVPGDYPNTTSGVTADVAGLTVTNSGASDDLTIASLAFTKEFIDNPVIPGDTATLRFTIENITTGSSATNISFSDDLNAALTGMAAQGPLPTNPCGAGSTIVGTNTLVFMGGTLAAGDSCSFDITVLIPPGTALGDYYNVTGALSANLNGNPVVLDTARDMLVVQSDWLALSKSFTDDPVPPGDDVTLEFILTNLHPTAAASNIAFTDDLDAALSGLAATGLPASFCGGTISGTGLLDFSGGSVLADDSCSFSVTVQTPGGSAASAVNTTSSVTGMINGLPVTGNSASDTLQLDFLDITKAFDGPTIAGGSPTLTFTIRNLDASQGASGISFTDDLNATLTDLVATGLPLNNICGPGSQISGTDLLTFTNGYLGTNGSCTFDVPLLAPATATAGDYLNTTSDISSGGIRLGDPATATLVVEPPPAFNKVFTPDFIDYGRTSALTFTINNTAGTLSTTNLDFTDNLPAGVVVANPSNAATTCTGGTVTAIVGSGVISYTGGSVNAGAACTIQADVTSTTPATHTNTTGSLTSSSGNSGPASSNLTVADPVDDGDGVSYVEESGPNGNVWAYDGNGDSIPDNTQGSVASLHTEDGTQYITLEETNGFQLANVTAVPNPSPGDAPEGINFPYGFFEFMITGLTPGQSTTLNLFLPEGAHVETYWKYGPMPWTPAANWYEFMYSSGTGATITDNVVSMVFIDGGRGDDDLTANGVIIDQGGPGASPLSVPTLSEWGLILLSTLLLAVACMAIRRRKFLAATRARDAINHKEIRVRRAISCQKSFM